MASRKARAYWQQFGYRNIVPNDNDIPKGRTGEAIIRGDRAAIELADEVPEVYEPTPSTYTSHDGHPRTSRAEYYPESYILRVFWGDEPGNAYNYYDVSRTEWASFRRVKSPGKYINRVLNNHTYGIAL
jgi:hypothetical protein